MLTEHYNGRSERTSNSGLSRAAECTISIVLDVIQFTNPEDDSSEISANFIIFALNNVDHWWQ